MESLVVNHLSRLLDKVQRPEIEDIKEYFPYEKLLMIASLVTPYYADIEITW